MFGRGEGNDGDDPVVAFAISLVKWDGRVVLGAMELEKALICDGVSSDDRNRGLFGLNRPS